VGSGPLSPAGFSEDNGARPNCFLSGAHPNWVAFSTRFVRTWLLGWLWNRALYPSKKKGGKKGLSKENTIHNVALLFVLGFEMKRTP
jgi:hypothetical protein